jgi:proteasome lid subunit RPN8/RPN11
MASDRDVVMAVKLSRSLYNRIICLARAEPEHEVCGLLLGNLTHITDIRPAPNVAEDTSVRFEIDPVILLATHREARANRTSVVGHYHSHPNGSSAPSVADATDAGADGLLWLIVGHDDARLWRAVGQGVHNCFQTEDLILLPG